MSNAFLKSTNPFCKITESPPLNQFPQIVQGEDKVLHVQVFDPSTNDPVDFSSTTGVTGCLANTDGSLLIKTFAASGIVVEDGPLGKLQILIASVESALLVLSTTTDEGLPSTGVQLDYVLGGAKTIVNVPNSISVQPPLFAGG